MPSRFFWVLQHCVPGMGSEPGSLRRRVDGAPPPNTAMNATTHRYHLTITALDADGLPDLRHCAIELQQASNTDWQQRLCHWKRGSQLHGDDYLAALLAGQLLAGLNARVGRQPGHPLARLQPHIDALEQALAKLT